MGLIRFLVPHRERISPASIERAYLTGLDEVPWACHLRMNGGELHVERRVDDSGCFHIPWSVNGYGETTLTTATLMERDRPYILEVELARGTINRLRNRVSDWKLQQTPIPAALEARLHQCVASFSEAVVAQSDPSRAAELAQATLEMTLPLTGELACSLAHAAIAARRAKNNKLTTLFGADLGHKLLDAQSAQRFLDAFNTAVIGMPWHDIEVREGEKDWSRVDAQFDWCTAHGLRVCSGPLLKFDRASVPDWLYLWEGDEETILSLITEHVREKIDRYRGRVHVWQCAARLVTGELLSLTQEQRMRMTIRSIELARQLDAQTPMVVTFDQPWGEHAARQESDLPLHFADALARSNLGLAGLGLEINLGYYPGGTLHRHAVEFGRQLDRWSFLGLPLLVVLTVPSASQKDRRARRPDRLPDKRWSPEIQAAWTREFLPVMLAQPAVQAVVWNQLRDDEPHDFAHAGLLDGAGTPKPALEAITELRRDLLF
ncbi:MAG: hypothetical protein DWQ31_19520 [Planctomycetota bacterium]|nr:MAG: hypothetical protein DWQ31_19520 [Planctomycetota bacterium]REJ93296.1 MAG: hypothetical protein DWQ35_10680 [Planctomycetota bacterium]REK30209.1 MAG: hypothetical protein DWQ42_02195 [Planctomycetota bacterium]REK49253.1 MAG: hypothetical protein DWQ46_00570 [Planctomycetota bacterium]